MLLRFSAASFNIMEEKKEKGSGLTNMKPRFPRTLILLLLCMALAFMLAAGSIADFGGFSGDSDYGGSSDWGGGSDWSSSSDWDSSSSGGSDGGPFTTIAVIAIIVIVILVNSGKKKKSGSTRRPVAPGATPVNRSVLKPVKDYLAIDPNFDEAAMKEKLANLYVQMQNCWTDGDIESLRPYFSDALFTQMERQLAQMKRAGRTNYVERIAVLGTELLGFRRVGDSDVMTAQLRTRIVDYTTDANGKVISGSQTKEKFMTYEWDLSRSVNSATAEGEDGVKRVTCPSCGAPLDVNASARCPYCGSVLQSGDHDWVLTAIRGISQRTA